MRFWAGSLQVVALPAKCGMFIAPNAVSSYLYSKVNQCEKQIGNNKKEDE